MKETGTVKWFNDAKGFGFITRQDGSDLFVHHTGIDMPGFRKLTEGQKVSFGTKKTDKGLQAVEVKSI